MRSIVLALICSLVGCVTKPAPVAPVAPPIVAAPAPVAAPQPPKNLVCEAFKGVNEKATCSPTFTDLGDLHVHTATITLGGQQLACRTDLSMIGVLCTDPIVIKQQPPAPTQDTKPDGKKPPKK